MASSDNKILGVVLMVRHGDRQGFYQSPTSYAPSGTKITPLGNAQEFQLGQKIRSIYLNSTSPSFISTINSSIVDLEQIKVRADAGGEGGVIFNSAMSLVQGMFPANRDYRVKLANGTTIAEPLNGYQYVALESVEAENDISLEGWTQCGAFVNRTTELYKSPLYEAVGKEHGDFLQSLPPYLDGRNVSFANMWNIFDYMNVLNVHDEKFHDRLPETYLAQARHLANLHEYTVFSSPELDGIGNIAGRTILPSFIESFEAIGNKTDPLKFVHFATAYKPFISIFNMTGAAEQNPQLAGIVNFSAALAIEVRETPAGEVVLRFNFKNGTDENDFTTYNFLGGEGDMPLSKFKEHVEPALIYNTADWCQTCGNTKDRGCAELVLAAANARASVGTQHHAISHVGAGFLGAGLTAVVLLAMLAAMTFLGCLSFGRRKTIAFSSRISIGSETDYQEEEKMRV